MFFPCIAYKEVGWLYGEIRQFTDMGRVGLCTRFDVIRLQIIKVDALIIIHTIEAVDGECLVNTINGSLNIFLALIEIILVDRTDGSLVQVSATCEQQACQEDICRYVLFHNLQFSILNIQFSILTVLR